MMEEIPYQQQVDWALENLRNTYIKVGPSKIEGVGIIAIRDILKDTIVMRFHQQDFPTVDIEKSILKKEIPEEVYDQLIKIWPVEKTTVSVPINFIYQLNYVNFLNHSEKYSNVAFKNGFYITKRNIQKGEEILMNFLEDNYCVESVHFKDKTKEEKP